MGKIFSKPEAPPTPDYAAAATAQGAANKETAIASWLLNNANQVTPYGTRTLSRTGPGETDYTLTTALNPADQQRLDQQRAVQSGILGLAPSALNTAQNVINSSINPANLPPMSYEVDTRGLKNLNYGGLPGQVYGVGDTGDIRQKMEDAAWGKYISRAAPMFQQQESDLNTRLANMGGVSTSPGAMRQLGALRTSQGDQARQAIFDSILQGGNAAQQEQNMRLAGANLWNTSRSTDAGLLRDQTQFNNAVNQQDVQNAFANANLGNATRTQGLNELAQLRQMPLNELMAMLSGGQVNSPQFQQVTPTNIAPAPLFQATQAQDQAAQNAYNTQVGSFNNILGDVAKLGSAWMLKPSDRRLKSNIKLIGKTPGGHNLYEYDLFGKHEIGVMADEVLLKAPSAVIEHPSGFLIVDYAQVS